ncbi:ATP-dependent DNA ligase [Puia sp.]|uniref:ATP-dependent DNA ligase n=1 Tax=Puia sp. TaxID=2045100 RepID=UPI002F4152B7
MRRRREMQATENSFGGMRQFASLVAKLGTSTKTNDKLSALDRYFNEAADADKVWMIALFSGRRPKRTVTTTQLWEWCREITGLPAWLFEESYHTVGDLAETIALLLPERPGPASAPAEESQTERSQAAEGESLAYYLQALMRLGKEDEPAKKAFVQQCWASMNKEERFVFNKLITGGFRIGISQQTVVNALARTAGVDAAVVAHRISGDWDAATTPFAALLSGEGASSEVSRPYPFYLAYALEGEPASLGDPGEWQAEWKWDGIRGQLIRRGDILVVWSRGEELMTEKFPEYQEFTGLLPAGTVLDGEIIGLRRDEPAAPGALPFAVLPFAALQTRIGRKNITKKNLSEVPVGFIAYDLVEYAGEDWRTRPLTERRAQLEKLIAAAGHPLLVLSPVVDFNAWEALATAREGSRDRGSEGIMLKRRSSPYQVGRKRGDWWKWKIDPLVIDAVLVYAQKGHGRRSNLYTDYTFAVRDGDQLVTFAKAYSGLTDKELAEVDAFVKKNSLEKFGPVRTVKPELVFEIAFEGIAASARHKSGVALRFPRINRWRKDKTPADIDTLGALKKMLELYGK